MQIGLVNLNNPEKKFIISTKPFTDGKPRVFPSLDNFSYLERIYPDDFIRLSVNNYHQYSITVNPIKCKLVAEDSEEWIESRSSSIKRSMPQLD